MRQGSIYLRVLHRMKRNYSIGAHGLDQAARIVDPDPDPSFTSTITPTLANCNAIALQVLSRLKDQCCGDTQSSENLDGLAAACFIEDEMELDTIADSLEAIAFSCTDSNLDDSTSSKAWPVQAQTLADDIIPFNMNDVLDMEEDTDLFLVEDALLMALHDALAQLTRYRGMSSGITSIMLNCFSTLQHIHDKHFSQLAENAGVTDSLVDDFDANLDNGPTSITMQARVLSEYVDIIQLLRRELVGWDFAGHGGFEVEVDATVENCAKALRKTLQVFAEKRLSLYYPQLQSESVL
jgi:hypothetical protein